MISTWIRDLLSLFIFTFLFCHCDCKEIFYYFEVWTTRPLQLGFFIVSKKLMKIWIWLLLLSLWENRILWQKVRSMFWKRIFNQPFLNHSSITVGNILERTFRLMSAPLSMVGFSTFYFLLNFELFSLDDPNQIWLLK